MGGNARLVTRLEICQNELPVPRQNIFNINEFIAAVIALGEAINQINEGNDRNRRRAEAVQAAVQEIENIRQVAIMIRDNI